MWPVVTNLDLGIKHLPSYTYLTYCKGWGSKVPGKGGTVNIVSSGVICRKADETMGFIVHHVIQPRGLGLVGLGVWPACSRAFPSHFSYVTNSCWIWGLQADVRPVVAGVPSPPPPFCVVTLYWWWFPWQVVMQLVWTLMRVKGFFSTSNKLIAKKT